MQWTPAFNESAILAGSCNNSDFCLGEYKQICQQKQFAHFRCKTKWKLVLLDYACVFAELVNFSVELLTELLKVPAKTKVKLLPKISRLIARASNLPGLSDPAKPNVSFSCLIPNQFFKRENWVCEHHAS